MKIKESCTRVDFCTYLQTSSLCTMLEYTLVLYICCTVQCTQLSKFSTNYGAGLDYE